MAPSRTGLCGGGSAPYPPCSAQLAQKNAESGIWSTHPECCQTPHRALQHRIMSSLPSSSTHPHSQWTHSNVASVNPGARLTPSISPGCGSASVPGRSSSSSSSSSKNATFSSSNTMKSTPSSSSSSSPRSISASSSARSISRSSASSRPIFSFSSETCSFQISDLRARPTLMRELVRFSPRSALSDVGVLLLTTAGLSIGGVSSSSLLSRMARGLCPGRTRRLGAGDAPPFSFPGESGASSSDSFSSPSSSAPPPRPRLFLSFLSRSRLDLADVGSATTIGWTATGDGGSTSSEEDVSFDADADAFLFLSFVVFVVDLYGVVRGLPGAVTAAAVLFFHVVTATAAVLFHVVVVAHEVLHIARELLLVAHPLRVDSRRLSPSVGTRRTAGPPRGRPESKACTPGPGAWRMTCDARRCGRGAWPGTAAIGYSCCVLFPIARAPACGRLRPPRRHRRSRGHRGDRVGG